MDTHEFTQTYIFSHTHTYVHKIQTIKIHITKCKDLSKFRSLNHTATALSPAYYNPNPTSVNVGMNEEYTFGSGWSPMSTSMTSPHGMCS